ncbi:hypothetical protein SASPL_144262 [Salvia splendens]|uniref:Uncharacterized protein n=1 Tax=Salvia splendens TaxID=180675 RepID=A0A8X8WPX6_SALSN|nr:hypothetical protein SASPL_144262 [Salvia splendens]
MTRESIDIQEPIEQSTVARKMTSNLELWKLTKGRKREIKKHRKNLLRVKSDYLDNVISATTARKLVRKGCEAYLAYILDTRAEDPKLTNIPIVSEYPDVFPEELPGLPPEREVEFAIEVIPGTTPISMAPYRMAPTELKELKAQLQELLDRGFIRPSVSP